MNKDQVTDIVMIINNGQTKKTEQMFHPCLLLLTNVHLWSYHNGQS